MSNSTIWCCSNINFELFSLKAKCDHWPTLCHVAEFLSLCLLLPCGGAADRPLVLCHAAWLASLQLLGKIAKTHLHWGFVLKTPTTSVLPVITPVLFLRVKLPPNAVDHMVCCLRAFEHDMMAFSVTSYVFGTNQSDLEPPFNAFFKRDTKVCE